MDTTIDPVLRTILGIESPEQIAAQQKVTAELTEALENYDRVERQFFDSVRPTSTAPAIDTSTLYRQIFDEPLPVAEPVTSGNLAKRHTANPELRDFFRRWIEAGEMPEDLSPLANFVESRSKKMAARLRAF
jgi:hypothetical protein